MNMPRTAGKRNTRPQPPSIPIDRVEFEPEELDIAEQWHGGQSSMLYAIASTGSLKRGIERCRPRVDCDACTGRGWVSPSEPCRDCRGVYMTDAQWLVYLAGKLESEAEECAEHASKEGLHDDAEALNGIAEKCRAAIAKFGGES
jgi:hypothetical protein